MLPDAIWNSLREKASQAVSLEKMRTGSLLRIKQAEKRGIPEVLTLPLVAAAEELRAMEKKLKRECAALCKGTVEADWVKDTHGMGPAIFYVIGSLPIQPGEHRTVSGLWKRLGLHVHEGIAVKRSTGDAGRHQRFNQGHRAYALYRVGEPHVKKTRSPYRRIYDERKAHTMVTHPPMRPEGEGCPSCDLSYERSRTKREESNQQRERTTVGMDCANLGGIHWKDGHRHADALRVMTKAIFLDLWRVQNGLTPKAKEVLVIA